MAVPLGSHCLQLVNDTLGLMIGGQTSSGFSESRTFFFDVPSRLFLDGPALHVGRASHACGTITDTLTNDKIVVAAGGIDVSSMEYLSSSEIWTTSNVSSWNIGPDLLYPLRAAKFAPFSSNSRLLLLGGRSETKIERTIFLWNCGAADGCQQTLLDQKLQAPRSSFVAIPLPEESYDFKDRNVQSNYSENWPNFHSGCQANDNVGLGGMEGCCFDGNICDVYEGSCNHDSQCKGDLVCGSHNCDELLGFQFTSFGPIDNCCTFPQPETSTVSSPPVTLSLPDNERNCTPETPCNAFEGLCLDNIDCQPGLLCSKEFQGELDYVNEAKGDVVHQCFPSPCCQAVHFSLKGHHEGLDQKFEGHFYRFDRSNFAPTWNYIQVGNYGSLMAIAKRRRLELRDPNKDDFMSITCLTMDCNENTTGQFWQPWTLYHSTMIRDIVMANLDLKSIDIDSAVTSFKDVCPEDLNSEHWLYWGIIGIAPSPIAIELPNHVTIQCT